MKKIFKILLKMLAYLMLSGISSINGIAFIKTVENLPRSNTTIFNLLIAFLYVVISVTFFVFAYLEMKKLKQLPSKV